MTVTIYTKPDCMPCRATKRALTKRGVEYVEAPAREHVATLARYGYQAAPVIVVEDTTGEVVDHWSGYRPDKCDTLVA
jgi:glutaredoxin-like protein NrdH